MPRPHGVVRIDVPQGMTEVGYSADRFIAGEEVFRWRGPTYGVISRTGVAVTRGLDEEPFLEIPRECVEWIDV